MVFDWRDFLVFAENIKAAPDIPGPKEAALRSATSRAYYAAFCVALEYGRTQGFIPTYTGEDHKGIQRFFRNSKLPHQLTTRLSTQLDRLYDFRRQADYRNKSKQKPENAAHYAIGIAKIVFECIDEISKSLDH